MHSSVSSTLPVLAILAATAAAARIPESILAAREAELQDTLTELYVRNALAEPGFGSWLKKEGHKIEGDAKKAGSWVANHQDQIVHGVQSVASVAEAVKPFVPKGKARRDLAQQDFLAELYARDADPSFGSFLHKAEHGVGKAAKGAAHWVGSHKKQIGKGLSTALSVGETVAPLLARDAALDDDELLELYIRDAYADPSFGSFIKGAEKKLGGAVKGAEKWVGSHKKQIGEGLSTAVKVGEFAAPLLLARDAGLLDDNELLYALYGREAEAEADPEAYAYPEAEPGFGSFLHKAEHDVGHAAKGAAKFVGKHKHQIGQGLEWGAKIGETVAPLLAREALLDEVLAEVYAREAEAEAEAEADPEAEAEEEDVFAA